MTEGIHRLDGARASRAGAPVAIGRARRLRLAIILAAACAATTAWAEAPSLDTGRCTPGTAGRLAWLVDRLDARELHADLWWRGWTGFYGLGVVIEGTRAGLEDDRGDRADHAVSAAKAVGGVTRLYFDRPVARLGSEPLRGRPLADEADCRRRVEEAEGLLRQAAKESGRRWDWKAHLANVAINMAGAVIVTEGFHENDGWRSGAVGIAVGEAMLWTHPWTGKDDLAEYEARFAVSDPGPRWSVVPHGSGLRAVVRF